MNSLFGRRAILSSIGSNALAPALAIVVSPIIARALGPYDRGLYAAVAAVASFLGVISIIGSDDAAVAASNTGTSKSDVARFLLITIPISGLGTFTAVSLFLNSGDFQLSLMNILLVAAAATALPIYNISIAWLKIGAEVSRINKALVVPAIVRSIFVLAACLLFQVGYVPLLVVTFLANLTVLLPTLRQMYAHSMNGERGVARIARTLGSRALVAWPGNLASLSLLRLDQIVGLSLVGASQLGLYAVAVSIAEIPLVVARAFRNLIYVAPFEEMRRLLVRAMFAVVVVCAGLAAISPMAIRVAFGEVFVGATPAALTLILGTMARAMSELIGTFFIRSSLLKVNTYASLFGLAVAIPAIYLLRDGGALGLATGSSVGYLAALSVQSVELLLRRKAVVGL